MGRQRTEMLASLSIPELPANPVNIDSPVHEVAWKYLPVSRKHIARLIAGHPAQNADFNEAGCDVARLSFPEAFRNRKPYSAGIIVELCQTETGRLARKPPKSRHVEIQTGYKLQ